MYIVDIIVYSVVCYLVVGVLFILTMRKRSVIANIGRIILFLASPITMPFYILYLVKTN